ncbi:MAG: ybgG, partial [Bacteroidetes bacterium]|nr:ybgG [Bacteroidota bacterium]
MKRFNRRNEQLAVASEKAAVVANCLTGSTYPADEIDESWKRFIWHQFHDDLTGTSIPKAYTFSWNDELISQS